MRRCSLALAVLLILGVPAKGHAQFFKVYPYGTPDAGAIEVSYWTTTIPSSDQEMEFFGDPVSKEDLWAHSLEVEYGLSHKFTVGYYADFLHPADEELRYIESKFLARYQFADKKSLPIDVAFYGEYIIPDIDHGDSEKFELRIILEKDVGPLRLDLNPILEKKTSGEEVEEGTEFAYAAGLYWENLGTGIWTTPRLYLRPGIEFFGEIGPLSDPEETGEQHHYAFPSLDLYFPRFGGWYIHWNVGAGFGLTEASDDVLLKSILSVEFLF